MRNPFDNTPPQPPRSIVSLPIQLLYALFSSYLSPLRLLRAPPPPLPPPALPHPFTRYLPSSLPPPPPPPPLVRLRYRHGNLILSGRPPSSSAYLCTTREKSWGGIRCSSPPELPWFAGGCHLERYSYRALIRRRVENFKHDRRSC